MKHFNEAFQLPFTPHEFQWEGVKAVGKLPLCLIKYKVGFGKTVTSTIAALISSLDEDVEQIIVMCKPHLLDQWEDWLTNEVQGIPSVVLYRGTPTQRKKIDIENAAVILISYNLLRQKPEFNRLSKIMLKRKVCIIADELSLKTLGGVMYKRLKAFLYRKQRIKPGDPVFHKLIALNAKPISKLEQIYNWCSIFAPSMYASKRKFLSAHARTINPWGEVTKWKNEEKLSKIMDLFTVDTDAKIKLPPEVEIRTVYALDPKHKKVYDMLCDEGIEDIDLGGAEFNPEAIFCVLQRLVLNPRAYGIDVDPPILEYLTALFEQVGEEGGVLIYTRHVEVTRLIAEGMNIPAYYGKVSQKEKTRIFKGLKEGSIRKVVANMDSLADGRNLQMLNHEVFAEIPFRGDGLVQTTGRIARQGQKDTCFFHFPLGKGTIQEKLYRKVFTSDRELSEIMRDEVSKLGKKKFKRGEVITPSLQTFREHLKKEMEEADYV